MERIYTFDPLASPRATDTESQDDRSDDESPEIDFSRLVHVYQALMSTLLSHQAHPTPATGNPAYGTTDAGNEVADTGNGGTDAAVGVKNAKRRKMDKKKAKREEQKQGKEEVVDSVEFKLFSRKPVKQISLLPSEDPSWITPNPRHVPFSEEGQRALRERIESVVVEGADVSAMAGVGRLKRRLEEYKLGSEPSNNIIDLQLPCSIPPFSQSFTLSHPGYTTQPTKPSLGKKSPAPTSKPLDPIRVALKRGPDQKSSRSAVHIQFTNNGKVLPASSKKEASSASVPIIHGKSDQRSRKEEKAHLHRIARRAHRLGLVPAPATHKHVHITPSTNVKPPTPWTHPFLGAHRFWAPAEGTGGKSGGYAVGFVGSGEGVRENEAGRRRGGVYLRDRMR